MKTKLVFLYFLGMIAFCACNKDKINLKIVSPADGELFSMHESIDVIVEADTKKGKINQVQLTVPLGDSLFVRSLTTESPYKFTIPANKLTQPIVDTVTKVRFYPLSVMAYSSKDVREGKSIYIKITE